MENLTLRIGGKAFAGWEVVQVQRTMEALCGSFRLEVSAPGPIGSFPINQGARCEIFIGPDLYLSGYVDRLSSRYSKRDHGFTVEGRDLAQDLVDGSPSGLDWEYYNVGLLELGVLLAQPFGVEVKLQAGVGDVPVFGRFAINPGETAHDALERACRLREFLLVSDALGTVWITRAGTRRATAGITADGPVEAVRWASDWSGRFHHYIVMGQTPGSDLKYGADCASMQGDDFDLTVRSQRTMVINAEGNVDDDLAQRRATWEANVRAARSRQLEVVVSGWRERHDRGPLWEPNVIVPVNLPAVNAFGDWLVRDVSFSLTPNENVATLSLVPPDAYLPEPPDPELEPDFEGEEE